MEGRRGTSSGENSVKQRDLRDVAGMHFPNACGLLAPLSGHIVALKGFSGKSCRL